MLVYCISFYDISSFHSSGVVGQIEYTFDFKLYEMIIPERCGLKIKGSAAYIGLGKKYKGIWPRITKEKIKVTESPHHTLLMDNFRASPIYMLPLISIYML